MVNLEKYFQKVQTVIGSTESADEIVEDSWLEVVKVLSQTAIECAQELQGEEKGFYFKPPRDNKPGYVLDYEKAPPGRLLALNLILSYWIGWAHGRSDALNMILKAYSTGKLDYDEFKKVEDEKKAAEEG